MFFFLHWERLLSAFSVKNPYRQLPFAVVVAIEEIEKVLVIHTIRMCKSNLENQSKLWLEK